MTKKRQRKLKSEETLRRHVLISTIRPRIDLSMRDASGPNPEPVSDCGLELRGTMTEPVRDVQDVTLNLWVDRNYRVGKNRPASVGFITQIRPAVGVIAPCRPVDFEYLWSLALSGQLTHAYLHFTKPRYRSASVLSMAFSNQPEE